MKTIIPIVAIILASVGCQSASNQLLSHFAPRETSSKLEDKLWALRRDKMISSEDYDRQIKNIGSRTPDATEHGLNGDSGTQTTPIGNTAGEGISQ
jgi:hypothetical protein